jgi:hypothetical protein
MTVLNAFYFWTDQLLFWGLLAFRVWAVIDCAIRKSAAFPAAERLTKPAWLAITGFGAVFGTLLSPPLGPISLISVVVAGVYLADVRPAVREVAGGSRW